MTATAQTAETNNLAVDQAERINTHLANGGQVRVVTALRATYYDKRHAGHFTAARGELFVKYGRGRNQLTFDSGRILLVKIQFSRPA